MRRMHKSDFKVACNSSNNRYVFMKDKPTKNHRGNISSESSQQGRMYETPGFARCPVRSFEKYIAKLNTVNNDCLAFWQKPKTSLVTKNDPVWYCNVAVGKNTLYEMMKILSTKANLSKIYINHCLKATCITALDHE